MSKTYKKNIRQFNCCGSNTKWYRDRNRMIRNSHRAHLRNILAHFPIEDADVHIEFKKFPKEDQWNEPTDGHYVYTKSMHEHDKKLLRNNYEDNQWREYFVKIANRFFKRKNPFQTIN